MGWEDTKSIKISVVEISLECSSSKGGKVAAIMPSFDEEFAAWQICFNEIETVEHLFLQCPLAQIIWRQSPWPIHSSVLCSVTIAQWIHTLCYSHKEMGFDKCLERPFLMWDAIAMDSIWMFRNLLSIKVSYQILWKFC